MLVAGRFFSSMNLKKLTPGLTKTVIARVGNSYRYGEITTGKPVYKALYGGYNSTYTLQLVGP